MRQRILGTPGISTSAIGLGCMGFSQGYGEVDDVDSAAAIHAACDAGVRMVDTAMSYGQGHNETLIGKVLRSERIAAETAVATKFGIVRGNDGVQLDGRPEHVAAYCDASLRRLGVDTIDLYYLHRVDPAVPIAETVGAMTRLVEVGKVRHLGVSEVTPQQLQDAVAAGRIAAVQFEWSLMWREPELALVPAARRLGVGLVPYSPLGRGLLTAALAAGEVDSSPFRANDPRFCGDHLTENLTQIRALDSLARSWGITTAQLCLAWLLAQGDDVVPIPGSRRAGRVLENAAAADIQLDADQLERIDEVAPPARWSGDRHSFAVPVTARPTTEGAAP